jgi:hypothetical protein
MEEFENANLTIEEGFWVMFYFLQKHYDLSVEILAFQIY